MMNYLKELRHHLPGRLVGGVVLAGLAGITHASEVVLAPDSPINELGIGDTFDLNVLIDFSDVAGGTLGGGFDIDFDANVLTLSTITPAVLGDEQMRREPDAMPGLLESWAVGDFDGLASAGQVLVGTVQFRVISTTVDNTQISIGPTASVGGPWISGDDFLSELSPAYNAVMVSFDPDNLYSSGFESP